VRSPKPMGDFIVVLNWFDQLQGQRRRWAGQQAAVVALWTGGWKGSTASTSG